MKIKDIFYKGLNISTEDITDGILLDEVIFDVSSRTRINENQLFHGGTATKTLSNLRLFTVYGRIIGTSAELRQNAMSILNNNTGYVGVGDEYFQLKFSDHLGGEYKVKAKIYKTPVYQNRQGSKGEPIIDFNFELLADTSEFISFETTNITETYNSDYTNGGVELPFELGDELGEYRGIVINNLGNFTARTRIEINGDFTDLKVYNNTNNRFYGVTGTYNNLLLDNLDKLRVESNSVDISSNRMSGSVSILLNPGINEITLIANSNTEGLNFKCLYSNTFI